MKENGVYRRGDLYLANLGVPVRSKQGGVQLGYYIPEQVEKKRQGKCRKEGEEGDG